MVFGLLVTDQACVIHEPEKSCRLSAFLLTANSVSFRRRNCLPKEAGGKCCIVNFVCVKIRIPLWSVKYEHMILVLEPFLWAQMELGNYNKPLETVSFLISSSWKVFFIFFIFFSLTGKGMFQVIIKFKAGMKPDASSLFWTTFCSFVSSLTSARDGVFFLYFHKWSCRMCTFILVQR